MTTRLPRDSPLRPDPPLPLDSPAAGRDSTAAPDQGGTARAWSGLLAVTVLLVAAAALDLSRCGIVVVTARHGRPAAGLVAAGLASAALSLAAARGSYRHRRWATWAAVLIGITSAPQAAATSFGALNAVPNTATAILGILLAVTVLATAGRGQPPG